MGWDGMGWDGSHTQCIGRIYPNDEDGVAIWLEADDQPPLPEL